MTRLPASLLLVIAALLMATAPASARHHRHYHRLAPACEGWFCGSPTARTPVLSQRAGIRGSGAIVGHPAGCPGRAFCGCGAAVEAFGAPIRSLWLARAWYRFPRAAPGPGMAEVRPHHVRIIRADLGGGLYQFYDANSGGGRTRVHADRIRGTIVNPHGGNRYAAM